MLPNELLLANIGFDTAENEPSRFWVPASVLVTKNIKKIFTITHVFPAHSGWK